MKNLTLALVLLPGLTLGQPSLLGGDTSPDWTATDINGNTHTLYDYLDQGYTVILDFSTTWCPPCASFHQSHVLKNLYEQHGPGTADNNVMVFLIESDDLTDAADLNGTGDQTPIDWVSGTPYPIIDTEAVGDLYGVFSFPTIYTICPSRKILTHGYGDAGLMWDQCLQCQHQLADSPNDAALVPSYNEIYCRDAAAPLTTRMINVGTGPLTSATIEAVSCYDSAVVTTVTWTGSLATYEETVVELPAWQDAPPGGQCVFFRLTSTDDDPENSLSSDLYFYQQSAGPSGTEVTIELLTDDHGDHLAWRLADTFGELLDRRDVGELENNTWYEFTYQLGADTCWSFIISNDITDALEAPGYYRLHSGGTTFITPDETWHTVVPGSLFVDQAYFRTASGVGIPEPELPTITVFPNPADAFVELKGPGEDGTMRLFDPTGRLVRQIRVATSNTRMPLHDLSPGSYSWVIDAQGRKASGPLLIVH